MATLEDAIARPRRRRVWPRLLLFLGLIVVGLAVFGWVTSLVLGIVRLILVVLAFVVLARVGLFLLRKGE